MKVFLHRIVFSHIYMYFMHDRKSFPFKLLHADNFGDYNEHDIIFIVATREYSFISKVHNW